MQKSQKKRGNDRPKVGVGMELFISLYDYIGFINLEISI